MATSRIRKEALSDLDLLKDVVEFKQRFYPASWANYQAAKPGSFRLIPGENVLVELAKDYKSMRQMIYGDYPDMNTLIDILQSLEDEVNSL